MERYRKDPEYRAHILANHRAWMKTKKGREHIQRRKDANPVFVLKQQIGKCQRCGYDKCMGALAWHHLDPEKKGRYIWRSQAIALIREELKNCILLCANCHAEEHFS